MTVIATGFDRELAGAPGDPPPDGTSDCSKLEETDVGDFEVPREVLDTEVPCATRTVCSRAGCGGGQPLKRRRRGQPGAPAASSCIDRSPIVAPKPGVVGLPVRRAGWSG